MLTIGTLITIGIISWTWLLVSNLKYLSLICSNWNINPMEQKRMKILSFHTFFSVAIVELFNASSISVILIKKVTGMSNSCNEFVQ